MVKLRNIRYHYRGETDILFDDEAVRMIAEELSYTDKDREKFGFVIKTNNFNAIWKEGTKGPNKGKIFYTYESYDSDLFKKILAEAKMLCKQWSQNMSA